VGNQAGCPFGGLALLAHLPTAPVSLPPQLSNAQFSRVKSITGADFTDALMRKDVQQMLCKIADGVNPTTGVATRDSLYCP